MFSNRLAVWQATNELLDELCVRSLRVCPDLLQRFLKVRSKQAAAGGQTAAFYSLCVRLFEQQLAMIRAMRHNCAANTSFLRSLALDTQQQQQQQQQHTKQRDDEKSRKRTAFLVDLVVHTSLPLCVSFQKLLTATNQPQQQQQQELVRQLLVTCLKCLNEWMVCVRELSSSDTTATTTASTTVDTTATTRETSDAEVQMRVKRAAIVASLRELKTTTTTSGQEDSLMVKLRLELLAKHLPKLDVFLAQMLADKEQQQQLQQLPQLFDLFTLYFDIFSETPKAANDQKEDMQLEEEEEESVELASSCLSLLQIETLDAQLSGIVANGARSLDVCDKYLRFQAKLVPLLSHEQQHTAYNSLDDSTSALEASIQVLDNGYTITERGGGGGVLNVLRMLLVEVSAAEVHTLLPSMLRVLAAMCVGQQHDDATLVYDNEFVYALLVLARKHRIAIESGDNNSGDQQQLLVKLFVDFLHAGLVGLLDTRQRNLVTLMSSQDDDEDIQFAHVALLIFAKTFAVFERKLTPVLGKERTAHLAAFLSELASLARLIDTSRTPIDVCHFSLFNSFKFYSFERNTKHNSQCYSLVFVLG